MVVPLSLMTLPLVLSNIAIFPSAVTEVGPVTAPSIFVCTTVQCSSFTAVYPVVESEIAINKSPTSHSAPA